MNMPINYESNTQVLSGCNTLDSSSFGPCSSPILAFVVMAVVAAVGAGGGVVVVVVVAPILRSLLFRSLLSLSVLRDAEIHEVEASAQQRSGNTQDLFSMAQVHEDALLHSPGKQMVWKSPGLVLRVYVSGPWRARTYYNI